MIVGNPVTFSCQSDTSKSIRWDYYKPGSTDPSVLYVGGVKNDRATQNFSININELTPGESNLTIYSNKLLDAGRYSCVEPRTDVIANAELIILGTHTFIILSFGLTLFFSNTYFLKHTYFFT